jgi:hypothetical protein
MEPIAHIPTPLILEIIVEDPPRSLHKKGCRIQWAKSLEAVRAQNGRWCRMAEYETNSQAGALRAWLKESAISRGFETCTRRVELDDGRKVTRLYARLVVEPIVIDGRPASDTAAK